MNKKMKRNLIIAAASLVLIVALILVIIFVPFGGKEEDKPVEIDYGIDMTASVNEDGLHIVKINTNSKGEIENNSYGTLVDRLPGDVNKVSMKTLEGNYTFLVENPVNEDGTTEASTYTLEGFEGYDLAATNPALLVGDVCNIDFIKVADLSGENAAEYGLDNPRVEATAYYSDGTYSTVYLGDDAPGGTHCYVQFGDNKTVYIVTAEEVDSLLLKITDQFSTSLNADKTSVSDESFDKITLGGTHLKEKIVIEANDDEKSLNCYYVLSSHNGMPVSATEGSAVIGTIKSLTAKEVVCVNPDKKQLEDYGLLTPYAAVETTYTYTESTYAADGTEIKGEPQKLPVSLVASEKDAEGMVYMMEKGGKLIYKISADSVVWATTTLEKLMSEYVLYPYYDSLASVVLEANGKSYKFDLSKKDVTITGEDGTTSTVKEPKVHLAGKEVDPDQFYILFQDLTLLEKAGEDSGAATTGEMLKVTYNYTTSRKSDTVVFYKTATQKVIPAVNSMKMGYVYKDYVTELVSNLEILASGKEISRIE